MPFSSVFRSMRSTRAVEADSRGRILIAARWKVQAESAARFWPGFGRQFFQRVLLLVFEPVAHAFLHLRTASGEVGGFAVGIDPAALLVNHFDDLRITEFIEPIFLCRLFQCAVEDLVASSMLNRRGPGHITQW